MNIVNETNNPEVFEYLMDLLDDLEYEEFVETLDDDYWTYGHYIVQINENEDISKDYCGFWKSNEVCVGKPIHNDWDIESVNEFTKVEPKDIVITKRIWEIVK